MKKKHTEIQKKIADTSMELFCKKGFDVSISEICESCGITRSSFYNQFSGKEDILLFIIENANAPTETYFDEFATAENDFERIWLIVDNRLKILELFSPAFITALFQMSPGKAFEVMGLTDILRRRHLKLYENCIRLGIASPSDNPTKVLYAAETAIMGHIILWASSNGAFDIRKEARQTAEIILRINKEYCAKFDE